MGLNIRIHDINVPSSFELFYKTGNTPGNMTVIENGYTQFGGIYPSSSSRNYNIDPVVFTGATFNTQYWFKIQYTGVTGQENSVGYIIENIKTHQPVGHIYYALHCCDFSGGVADFYTGCTFSGGTVVYGVSLDPTSAPTSTPVATPLPTPDPTATTIGATPDPTNTQTPTPTGTAGTTPIPTNTPTPTPTETIPGATPNPTQTPDATSGPTSTPTETALPGICYQMIFPTSATSSTGQVLYICYTKTDDTAVCEPYYQYEDSGANSPSITVKICSKTEPSIKYGLNGNQNFPDMETFNVTTGSGCIVSSDCGGNDPLPPSPTATAEVITNDSGDCYRWSVDDGNNNSGMTVTYTPIGANVIYTVNVNEVESDTQYYYICTKTEPIFMSDGNGTLFPSIQDGTCSLVDGVYSGCQSPIPDATPNPTATNTPTPTPTQSAVPGSRCISITEYNTQGTVDCLLNNVPYYYTVITALLTDGSGNAVNAIGDVSAYVSITENILYQLENTLDYEIKILNGTSSGEITVVTSIPVDNGQGNCENETRVINSYSAQSGYSICTP
jgi:hypothetical protein